MPKPPGTVDSMIEEAIIQGIVTGSPAALIMFLLVLEIREIRVKLSDIGDGLKTLIIKMGADK